MAEEKYDIHPGIADVVPPQQEEHVQEVEEAPVQEIIDEPKPSFQETDKEKNFRILRERAERAERERDEAIRIASQSQQYKQTHEPQEDDDSDVAIGSDDIVEGKHLSKVQKQIKKLKDEISHYKQQSQTSSAEQRLKSKYPDFDQIVTRDNIETLRVTYPELAATLQSSNDLYNTGVSAYELIKRFNIDQSHNYEVARAQKNLAKPRPTASISPQQGDTPLTRANAFANGLTDEVKKQLFKEMNEYRKNY